MKVFPVFESVPHFLIVFFFFLLVSVVFRFCYSKVSLGKLHTSTIRRTTVAVSKCLFMGVPVYVCGCSYAQWNNNLIHRVVPSIVTDLSCYTLFHFAENWGFRGSYCFKEPVSGGTCTLFCKWNQDHTVTQPVLRPSLMTSLLSQHQEIVQGPQVSSRNPTPVQIKSRKSPFPGGSLFYLLYSSQPLTWMEHYQNLSLDLIFTFMQWGDPQPMFLVAPQDWNWAARTLVLVTQAKHVHFSALFWTVNAGGRRRFPANVILTTLNSRKGSMLAALGLGGHHHDSFWRQTFLNILVPRAQCTQKMQKTCLCRAHP